MSASGPGGPPSDVVPSGPAVPGGPEPHDVPSPPPGPGAVPPFAVPPSEGRTARVWIGVVVAALAVLLCCGGGAATVIGLVVASEQAAKEQRHAVVSDYLNAVTHHDYNKAYGLLCDRLQRQETRSEFEQQVKAGPQITGYRIGKISLDSLTVPVDVTYRGGSRDTLQFQLAQNRNTGGLEVCGVS